MIAYEVELLSEEGAKEMLRDLIEQMDALDEEDFFGTAGWRHRFGYEER